MVALAEQKKASILAVKRGQEVVVRRKNDIGILFHISTLLSENDVNILGVSAGVCGEDCLIRLITDDNRKAEDVLSANSFLSDEESVVLVDVSHRSGTLKQLTKVLAQEGIDIRHVYAAADKEEDKCLFVLHSSNDEVALAKLNECQIAEERQTDEERNVNMVSEGAPTY
jgi:hypothetical protein